MLMGLQELFLNCNQIIQSIFPSKMCKMLTTISLEKDLIYSSHAKYLQSWQICVLCSQYKTFHIQSNIIGQLSKTLIGLQKIVCSLSTENQSIFLIEWSEYFTSNESNSCPVQSWATPSQRHLVVGVYNATEK